MSYQEIIKKCEESKYLISMTSVDDIVRFGYSIGVNENSNVLDLCCGYGTVLKIWCEAFGITGIGVDRHHPFIFKGRERLRETGLAEKIRLIEADVMEYADAKKYDVVICSETIDSIQNTLTNGEKFLKQGGVLAYQKTYSKIPEPPQELVDFEGELLTLSDLNRTFNELNYYIAYMAGDSNSEWERYITSDSPSAIENIRRNSNDQEAKEWFNKWYRMYFDYRRPYQGQALFGLLRL